MEERAHCLDRNADATGVQRKRFAVATGTGFFTKGVDRRVEP